VLLCAKGQLSPAILYGAEKETSEVPPTVVQRSPLDQVEVGGVLKCSLVLGADDPLSNCLFAHFSSWHVF
jgi:hypothetical protein